MDIILLHRFKLHNGIHSQPFTRIIQKVELSLFTGREEPERQLPNADGHLSIIIAQQGKSQPETGIKKEASKDEDRSSSVTQSSWTQPHSNSIAMLFSYVS